MARAAVGFWRPVVVPKAAPLPRASRGGGLSCAHLGSLAAVLSSSLNSSCQLNLAEALCLPICQAWLSNLPGSSVSSSSPRMLQGARAVFCCLHLGHLICVNSWFTNPRITVPFLLFHNLIQTLVCFLFFGCTTLACGILPSSLTGNEPAPLAVRMQSPNHWTTREFLLIYILNSHYVGWQILF